MEIIKAGSDYFWDTDHVIINLMLNVNCNFTCSYCCNYNTRDKIEKKQLDFNIVKNFVMDLFTLKRDKYTFLIAGGEPTLYKHLHDFYKLLEEYSSHKISVSLSTNGSLLDRLVPIIEDSPNINKLFGVSIHEEQININKYKKLIENFKYPEQLTIKFMLKPGSLDLALDFKNFIENLGAECILVGIFDENTCLLPEYTEDEIMTLEKLQKNAIPDELPHIYSLSHKIGNKLEKINYKNIDSVLRPELINFKDMICLAGRNFINITPNGKVYRCHNDKTGVDFNLSEKSILEYPNMLKLKPCKVDKCICYSRALPKWRESTHLPHYIKQSDIA